jgi:hypothetical protein
MYERKIKKGSHTGESGWGCPMCFMLLPEHKHKEKLADYYVIPPNLLSEFLLSTEKLEEEDDDFDFWNIKKDDDEESSE